MGTCLVSLHMAIGVLITCLVKHAHKREGRDGNLHDHLKAAWARIEELEGQLQVLHLQRDEDAVRSGREIQVEMETFHRVQLKKVREYAHCQGYNEDQRASNHFQGTHPPI